jgi:5-methylcytosine-specific restriction endonuclease McrA
MSGVVVQNTSREAIAIVSWQRAITMLHAGLAELVEAVEGKSVSSPSVTMQMPKVIRLIKDVIVKFATRSPVCSKKGVLRRDKWTCVYCSRSATTVDHIIPRARGGKSTWENLAACCQPCNNAKADKSVKEAGLRLQWIPQAPEAQEAA